MLFYLVALARLIYVATGDTEAMEGYHRRYHEMKKSHPVGFLTHGKLNAIESLELGPDTIWSGAPGNFTKFHRSFVDVRFQSNSKDYKINDQYLSWLGGKPITQIITCQFGELCSLHLRHVENDWQFNLQYHNYTDQLPLGWSSNSSTYTLGFIGGTSVVIWFNEIRWYRSGVKRIWGPPLLLGAERQKFVSFNPIPLANGLNDGILGVHYEFYY